MSALLQSIQHCCRRATRSRPAINARAMESAARTKLSTIVMATAMSTSASNAIRATAAVSNDDHPRGQQCRRGALARPSRRDLYVLSLTPASTRAGRAAAGAPTIPIGVPLAPTAVTIEPLDKTTKETRAETLVTRDAL